MSTPIISIQGESKTLIYRGVRYINNLPALSSVYLVIPSMRFSFGVVIHYAWLFKLCGYSYCWCTCFDCICSKAYLSDFIVPHLIESDQIFVFIHIHFVNSYFIHFTWLFNLLVHPSLSFIQSARLFNLRGYSRTAEESFGTKWIINTRPR